MCPITVQSDPADHCLDARQSSHRQDFAHCEGGYDYTRQGEWLWCGVVWCGVVWCGVAGLLFDFLLFVTMNCR